ncbi:hypothetical protein FRC11_012455 [Ceratobasidium sp. 423]|nr:hypothetical protein FRC11_012455 [Ceratobasidium sp. 423]
MNKAHAMHFSRTGQIPEGATPVKPGVSRTTSAPVLGKPAPLEVKPKASSMNAAVGSSKPGSVALGKSGGEATGGGSSKPAANGASKSGTSGAASGSKPSGTGSKPTAGPSKPSGIMAGLARGTPTPVGNGKSTSINTVRNASTSANNNSQTVEVWTDGSCLGNGKPDARAAYAVYFGPDDPRNEAKRAPGPQTNNTGEIYAVIRALEIVPESVKHLTIYTDSEFTIKSLREWLPGWNRRGGMTSTNKPAVHYLSVKYMDALAQRRGERLKLVHVYGHKDNVGNNAADQMAQAAARDSNVPPARDWKLECVKLQKKPLIPVTGSPTITAVDSVPIKTEPDDGSDYGYSDIDLDDAAIDDVDAPLSRHPSDYSTGTRDTSLSADDKPAAGKKRAREPVDDEIPDSDNERKVARKKAKEQGVKCPNCKHKFNVTLRK